MKIIGIIPARYNSTRLKAKPLIQINNKPLIQLTYESVMSSDFFDEVLIATDSEKIQNTVNKFGGKCIISVKEHRNGTERCAELVKTYFEKIDNNDLIVNIQCDEPFLEKKHFEKIINLFHNPTEIGTLISKINNNDLKDQSIVKVSTQKNLTAINFSRIYKKNENFKYKHIGVYAYQKKTLLKLGSLPVSNRELNESLEQLRWLENGYKISCRIIKKNLISINTKNDIKKVDKNNL